jgi:competence protein ComEC
VVRTPAGRTWLVDAGPGGPGRLDLGETVVAPYLRSMGTRRLEGFVLSHAHPDHVGGASAVVRAFPVGAVWEGPAPRHDASYSDFDRLLRATRTVRLSVARGFRADWDGVGVEVLAPEPPPRPPWTARNDDSLVLALRYGDVTLLLAGDIEKTGESRLAPARADVLKVPHHGSRTSSSPPFLAAARPRLALVSSGFRNPYGHPHPDVLERYRRLRCLLRRTDRDGAISISTDGREIRVTTFNGLADRLEAEEGRTPRGL